MTKTQKRETWEGIRERGFLRFVVVTGALKWGVGTAVLCSLVLLALTRTGTELDPVASLQTAFVAFPILGVFFATALWILLDRKFSPRRRVHR